MGQVPGAGRGRDVGRAGRGRPRKIEPLEQEFSNLLPAPVLIADVDTDETLYARIRKGDMRAFDVLYGRYEARLFGFLLSQLRSRQDAEDVLHEAFLKSLRAQDASFGHEGAFRAWLFRIARNEALNHRRSTRRGAHALAAHQAMEMEEAPHAEDELQDRQLLGALDRAVERLPEALSELFFLRTSGLSYEEMATVTGVPLGTLKSRMHQMVNQLREELTPWTAR